MRARLLIALVLLAIGCAPATAATARRVALVIGNGAYESTVALANPVRDARAMSAKLSALGFHVTSGYDQDLASMQRTINDFARTAIGADMALMFYAGHGIQVRGDNYLIPIDATFADETALDFETVPVNFVMRQMSRDVRVRMVILDACRNNPLARSLARAMGPSRAAALAEGLAEIKIEDPGEGTVIAFATSPGDVAYDGDSQHSPFTEALLTHIDTPDTPIQNVMTRVTRDVYTVTAQRQRPWVNASLIGEIYLNKTAALPAAAAAAVASSAEAPAPAEKAGPAAATAQGQSDVSATIAWDREKSLFDFAQKTGAAEDYRAYLEAYPQGHFAEVSRNALARAEVAGGKLPGLPVAALTPSSTPVLSDATAAPAPEVPTTREEAPAAPEPPVSGARTSTTEEALGWDRAKRREVQIRLELSGRELGSVDGSFGPKTRSAASAWQAANGLAPSGFFTAEHYALLVSQTGDAYAKQQAEARQAAEKRKASAKKATSTKTRSTRSTSKKVASKKTTAPTKKTASRPAAPAPHQAEAEQPRYAPVRPVQQHHARPGSGAAILFGTLLRGGAGGVGISIGGGY
jgi:uncharacterized caspase-like protein/peptidoglycan hydrolase-like protein with peptidoglycan-binding domain